MTNAARLLPCVGLLAILCATGCAPYRYRESTTIELRDIGKTMAPWTTGGEPGKWERVSDPTSPSGKRVLAQTSEDPTNARFALCVAGGVWGADVDAAVQFKPVSGKVDQAGGIVVRVKDKNNYYLVRANALENNVRFYKVENGKRQQLAGKDVNVPSGQWQSLRLAAEGSHFRVYFHDKLLFEADDQTFPGPGEVGVWTKADSVTYFDDLRVWWIPLARSAK